MKVVLTHVRIEDRRLPPLGLAYLAGYLIKKGVDVKMIDPTPKQLDKGFNYVEEILRENPDLAGFYVSAINSKRVKEICDKLKGKVPIVLGGPQITAAPKDILYDYNVVGEGEETLYDLVKMLQGDIKKKNVKGLVYKEKGKIKRNKPRPLIQDLDSLPEPARHLLPLNWYFQRDSMGGL